MSDRQLKTLQQLASDAIAVQNASNLSGVAHSFAQAVSDLRQHVNGSAELNQHAIVRLWIDKLQSLSHMPQAMLNSEYEQVYRLAETATQPETK